MRDDKLVLRVRGDLEAEGEHGLEHSGPQWDSAQPEELPTWKDLVEQHVG